MVTWKIISRIYYNRVQIPIFLTIKKIQSNNNFSFELLRKQQKARQNKTLKPNHRIKNPEFAKIFFKIKYITQITNKSHYSLPLLIISLTLGQPSATSKSTGVSVLIFLLLFSHNIFATRS